MSETEHRHSRTLLVSYLGSIVRRFGGWMPIAGTVALMGELDVDESSVRTAVFRLKRRGWLVPEKRGGVVGYRLTDEALTTLGEGDDIVWHARTPAALGDGWCIVTFSVPESERARRHVLRSHLSSLGFGNTAGGVWIAPARMEAAATRVIVELDMSGYAAVFVGRYAYGAELRDLVAASWDLKALNDSYGAFIAAHRGDSVRVETEGPHAFRVYLSAVDEWRQLPFHDPGLPRELLWPTWHAHDAGVLFESIVANTEGQAIAYAGRFWPTPG